jgi:hypothetical protein
MPGTIEQVFAKQFLQVRQDFRITGRMQAVATVVGPYSVDFKARGIAPYGGALFDHGGMGNAPTRKLICGTHARRART